MRQSSSYSKEINMTQLTLEVPESAFATLHQAPKEFAQEMRIAATVKWYELGRISQGRAAEIAGLTRAGFIDALSRYKVSPFQYTAEELSEELRDAD
jgi:predicted HTH domain antitoxin